MIGVGSETERTVIFTEEIVASFAKITGDRAPVHFDQNFAQKLGYREPIVHGFLVSSFFSEMLGCHLPGPDSVIQKFSIDFHAPVYINQTIRFKIRVTQVAEAVSAVSLSLTATNEENQVICQGKAVCILRQERLDTSKDKRLA